MPERSIARSGRGLAMAGTHQISSHVPLKGSRRYMRAGSQVLGPADREEWVEVTVKVRRKAALPEPDPGNPISQAALATQYGADPNDLNAVETELAKFGLVTTSKDEATHKVTVAGPVSAMEEAFGVNLFRAKHNENLYRGRVGL